MTASYAKSGVRFLYPENWQITDEETVSWPHTVSVQSPEGGFWSLVVYPRDDKDPQELVDEALSTMRQEYEGLEAYEVRDDFQGVETAGYDMCFYCLDFLVNARALAVGFGGQTLLMLWQAEDREFQRMEPVFRAITTSLLSDTEGS